MTSRHRKLIVAFVAGVLAVSAVAFVVERRVRETSNAHGGPRAGVRSPIAGPSTPIVSTGTPPTTMPATAPTRGATSVAAFGANGSGRADDTAAFTAAMTAALAGRVRFAAGPGGHPQAVVRVPAGTYRIFHLAFVSNIRLEVDAGASLEQAGNRSLGDSQGHGGPALIVWDGPAGHALTNVSIVAVGTTSTVLKRALRAPEPGWNLTHSFVFDLNTPRTGGDNFNSAMQLGNVDGFLVSDVVILQNGIPTDSTDPVTGRIGLYPKPTSSRAALVFVPRNDSGLHGPYYDPHNGRVRNVYNWGGPYGYGATQVTSGHNLKFAFIFSKGGTALRLETDANLRKPFGAELRGVIANQIVGVSCNRAVAFVPHSDKSFDVQVSNVTARACQAGVIESQDESLATVDRGSFTNSTLSGVTVVGGTGAQIPVAGRPGLWKSGASTQAFDHDEATWYLRITGMVCKRPFTKVSGPILLNGSIQTKLCAP